MADKIDRKLQDTVAGIVSPKTRKRRRSDDTRVDHNIRLTEARISRLVRGAQKRNERKERRKHK